MVLTLLRNQIVNYVKGKWQNVNDETIEEEKKEDEERWRRWNRIEMLGGSCVKVKTYTIEDHAHVLWVLHQGKLKELNLFGAKRFEEVHLTPDGCTLTPGGCSPLYWYHEVLISHYNLYSVQVCFPRFQLVIDLLFWRWSCARRSNKIWIYFCIFFKVLIVEVEVMQSAYPALLSHDNSHLFTP